METKVRCPQKKCSFNIIIGMGCRACEECGCEPNIIDENCDRCLNCSRDEGDLRWGNTKQEDGEKTPNVIFEKPIGVEA